MLCLQKLRYLPQKPKQLPFLDFTERFLDADIGYVLNYTSNIITVTQNGTRYFFKEAKEKQGSLRACIQRGVDDFFCDIVHNPSLREMVLTSLQKRSNLRRLVNMGYKNVRTSRFNRYLISGDESCLGLPSPSSPEEKQQLRKLIFYLYGELQNWFYNARVRPGELQTFSAVRALGVRELARMLSVEELIVHCDFVKVKLGGRVRYGILSEEAEGDTLLDCPPEQRARLSSPELLRSLTNLNLLDTVSGDNDHRIGNYHVLTDEAGKYSDVLSYDNDSPATFGLSPSIRFKNVIGCSSFIRGCGTLNRAHLDKTAAEALLGIKRSELGALAPYLTPIQRFFLWSRISRVKRAISKTLRSRGDLLAKRNEWSAEHMKRDLSGKYGKTYLASLLSDCYYETGMHDFDTL